MCIISFIIYYFYSNYSKDSSDVTSDKKLIENKSEKEDIEDFISSSSPNSVMSYSTNNSESGQDEDDILNFF